MFSVKFNSLINIETVQCGFIDVCTRYDVVYLEELLCYPCMRAKRTDYSLPRMGATMYPWYTGMYQPKPKAWSPSIALQRSEYDDSIPLFIRM